MSARPLCLEPHPVLRQPARRVERFNAPLKRLVGDMIETMYANDGIGLAAPQIGEDLQLFVASPAQRRGRELVVANPVMVSTRGRAGVVEGCLSVPEIWERVRRAASVRMTGQDLTGAAIELDAEGLLAIVLQHEYDHLHGTLFIDRVSWLRRRRAMAKYRRAQAR